LDVTKQDLEIYTGEKGDMCLLFTFLFLYLLFIHILVMLLSNIGIEAILMMDLMNN